MANVQSITPFPADVDRISFGHWLSGFTDGEGCFHLQWKGKNRRTAQVSFLITLRDDDHSILEAIQSFFGCGKLYFHDYASGRKNAHPQCTFRVSTLEHLCFAVIPHFDKFPLRAKKSRDYAIWKLGALLAHRVKSRKAIGRSTGGYSPKWKRLDIQEFARLHDKLRGDRQYDIIHAASDVRVHSEVEASGTFPEWDSIEPL